MWDGICCRRVSAWSRESAGLHCNVINHSQAVDVTQEAYRWACAYGDSTDCLKHGQQTYRWLKSHRCLLTMLTSRSQTGTCKFCCHSSARYVIEICPMFLKSGIEVTTEPLLRVFDKTRWQMLQRGKCNRISATSLKSYFQWHINLYLWDLYILLRLILTVIL
jgi:hypothetical protein